MHHAVPPRFIAASMPLHEQFDDFLNPRVLSIDDNAEPTAAESLVSRTLSVTALNLQCLLASHRFIALPQFTHEPSTHSHKTFMLERRSTSTGTLSQYTQGCT